MRLGHELFDSFQESFLIRIFRLAFEMQEEVLSTDYQVKAVETEQEYFEALSLLHTCYVKKGLMAEDPRRIRLGIHHLLPETNIIIVKHRGVCVGTGTIIHRGDFPFPSHKAFAQEVDRTLSARPSVLEFSGLAVHPDFRSKGNLIQLLMIKFYYQLSNMIYENPHTRKSSHNLFNSSQGCKFLSDPRGL